jgi:hypothetical protein
MNKMESVMIVGGHHKGKSGTLKNVIPPQSGLHNGVAFVRIKGTTEKISLKFVQVLQIVEREDRRLKFMIGTFGEKCPSRRYLTEEQTNGWTKKPLLFGQSCCTWCMGASSMMCCEDLKIVELYFCTGCSKRISTAEIGALIKFINK